MTPSSWSVSLAPTSSDPLVLSLLPINGSLIEYWRDLCGMQLISSGDKEAVLCFEPDQQCHLKLVVSASAIDHASAFGRIAFSCPQEQVGQSVIVSFTLWSSSLSNQLSDLQRLMDDRKEVVLTRLVSLDTPGKATVEVVILADPVCVGGGKGDGHM